MKIFNKNNDGYIIYCNICGDRIEGKNYHYSHHFHISFNALNEFGDSERSASFGSTDYHFCTDCFPVVERAIKAVSTFKEREPFWWKQQTQMIKHRARLEDWYGKHYEEGQDREKRDVLCPLLKTLCVGKDCAFWDDDTADGFGGSMGSIANSLRKSVE